MLLDEREGNLDIWVQRLVKGEAQGEPFRLTHDPADELILPFHRREIRSRLRPPAREAEYI